jgi:hypothetical protein
MTLPVPNLDDRDFNQLLEEARRRITQSSPHWTDFSPGDPGMVLLELFAFLTETTIYRLNRLPRKAYIEFLNLIGVHLQPPAAAIVSLQFSRVKVNDQPIEIPRGTRVTVGRTTGASEPPMFVTAQAATLAPGKQQVDVLAYHCDLVEGELAGHGTGLAGLSLTALRPPLIAATGDELDLLVGVETAPEDLDERVAVIRYGNKTYRIWHEVSNFSNLDPADPFVYLADRMTGTIIFAPAVMMPVERHPAEPAPQGNGATELETTPRALAAIPLAGREIRLWYRCGGGANGNVAANTLTVLKDPLPGVLVTNPQPAGGGRAAEPLENALIRGPQQMHSLQRAVTARDFEMLALSSSRAVARARAFAQASLWTYAQPGTVDVLIVPYLPDEEAAPGQLTGEALHAHDSEGVRAQIENAIDQRRPMGITCNVKWARYKQVRVRARIIVRREEDKDAICQRVARRLYQTISPLPTVVNAGGWPFGQTLRASDVYDILLDEPGVRWVDQVRMGVGEVPEQSVTTLARDAFQPHTWYAGGGAILFRSLNNGDGWEPAGRFAGRQVTQVRVHPRRPGLLACLTQKAGEAGSQIHISSDCGETWAAAPVELAFQVRDLAWTLRGDTPMLLLATDVGLYELVLRAGSSPIQVLVDPANQALGFYAVTVATDTQGVVSAAVAAENGGGLYLSKQGGLTKTFRLTGLRGEDVRRLAIQSDGPRTYLWAGTASAGPDDNGKGCYRWELRGTEDPPEGWQAFNKGWTGGSVRGLTFTGSRVLAASHHGGVMRLDASALTNPWQAPNVNCGLPLRDPGRFHPVDAVMADEDEGLTLSGGLQGVVLSRDEGVTYQLCSSKEFTDKVTLPDTWLFVSGEHGLDVVYENEVQ